MNTRETLTKAHELYTCAESRDVITGTRGQHPYEHDTLTYKAHANCSRAPPCLGLSSINFYTGTSAALQTSAVTFFALHGVVMLLAWGVFGPIAFYVVRYKKVRLCNVYSVFFWCLEKE
jgi:hypothetical protein